MRSLVGYALLVALFASGCPRKTDAQRAAEERAEAARKVERSLLLVPYRSVKTLFRARATATPPSELAPLYTALDATRALPGPSDESVRATDATHADHERRATPAAWRQALPAARSPAAPRTA